MSILLGQSPQTVVTGTVVYGNMRWGHNAISSVYQDTAATIDYIVIKAKRVGTSGDVTISIYDTTYTDFANISGLGDGDSVTIGNLLGSKTEDSSGWSNAAYDSHTFTFTTPISLPDYGIFIVSISHPGGNINNCISWAFPTGSSYTQVRSADGGTSWTKETGVTGIYQTYGTVLAAPEQATILLPTDAADDVTLDQATITWEDGGRATSYDVYYGDNAADVTNADTTDETGIYLGNQVAESFTITDIILGSPFDYLITRYWRIDAVNSAGTTAGTTWSFTSINFDQLRVSYVLIDGGSGAGPYDDPAGVEGTDWSWTGLNNMISVRRLVVAANNKIYYESI